MRASGLALKVAAWLQCRKQHEPAIPGALAHFLDQYAELGEQRTIDAQRLGLTFAADRERERVAQDEQADRLESVRVAPHAS